MRRTGPDPATRDEVYARAQYRCERCGTSEGPFAIHHRKPRRMGGTRDPLINDPSNLSLLCEPCHSHIESFRAEALDAHWLLRSGDDPTSTHPVPLPNELRSA